MADVVKSMESREETVFDTVLRQYFEASSQSPLPWQISVGAGGMNNTTRFVQMGTNRYVLRIYETHRDEDKVAYEHHVLQCLQHQPVPGYPTPQTVPSLNGQSMVRTGEGKLAALFVQREGKNPTLRTEEDFLDFGRAAGALSASMAGVRPEREPLYRPYYELCLDSQADMQTKIMQPLRDKRSIVADMPEALDVLEQGLLQVHGLLPVLQKLPHQLIHGDLNASNVLADEKNRIVALLDFEFVAWDLRVMELAVCMSEVAGGDPAGREDRNAALQRGFLEQVPLTVEELAVLPTLLLLRHMDVFLHFLNRWRDGVDSPENVRRFLGEVHRAFRLTNFKENA